jgi:hypothetical protein
MVELVSSQTLPEDDGTMGESGANEKEIDDE